jgi:hypothetical protein
MSTERLKSLDRKSSYSLDFSGMILISASKEAAVGLSQKTVDLEQNLSYADHARR